MHATGLRLMWWEVLRNNERPASRIIEDAVENIGRNENESV